MAPLGLQAPTETLLEAEAFQPPRVRHPASPTSGLGALESAKGQTEDAALNPVSTLVLKAVSCLPPLWALGLSGPALPRASKYCTFTQGLQLHFLKGHQRSVQGWKKPHPALACTGAPKPLCHKSQRDERRKQLSCFHLPFCSSMVSCGLEVSGLRESWDPANHRSIFYREQGPPKPRAHPDWSSNKDRGEMPCLQPLALYSRLTLFSCRSGRRSRGFCCPSPKRIRERLCQ